MKHAIEGEKDKSRLESKLQLGAQRTSLNSKVNSSNDSINGHSSNRNKLRNNMEPLLRTRTSDSRKRKSHKKNSTKNKQTLFKGQFSSSPNTKKSKRSKTGLLKSTVSERLSRVNSSEKMRYGTDSDTESNSPNVSNSLQFAPILSSSDDKLI